ncbi:MAG: BatA domain-containing protein [Planctomycetes bacterium]|nr:BatA domain-containing protein [Planctomycetota bacterium]
MNFLFPGMLWALPLVSLPVIIHLLNRQRYQKIEFGAMEFLRRAIKRTRRRVLLEDIMLLTLRTLAVLFLILGLASPTLGPGAPIGSRAPRAEVVVLDYSMSMNRRVEGSSAFERASEEVRALLEDLDPTRGDRAALILAGTRATRPAYGNPVEVRLALDELEIAAPGSAALAEALESARRTAESLENESGLTPMIRVYSDLQASSWELDGPLGEALQQLATERRIMTVHDVGFDGANTGVLSLELSPSQLNTRGASEVRAVIRRFGPARRVRASLLLDGNTVHSETIELAQSAEHEFQYLLQPAQVGVRGVTLRLEGDELTDDDARHGILRIAEALPTLVVGQSATDEQADGIFEAVVRYLDLGPTGPLVIETEDPYRVRDNRLDGIGLLVLADPGPINTSAAEAIVQLLERGGGLCILPGPSTEQSHLAALWEHIAPESLHFDEPIELGEDIARLAILDDTHPALQLFLDPRWRPLLTEVPHLSFRPIRTPVEDASINRVLRFAGSQSTDITFGDALVTWQHEAGRIALLTAAPLPLWNLMDQVPGGTLPFLLDLAQSLAPRASHPNVVEIGQEIAVDLPGAPAAVALLAPDGRRTVPAEPAEPLSGGRTRLQALTEVILPGLWTIEADLLEADGLESRHVERVAVNPPASESDPTPANSEAVRIALPEGSQLIRAGAESASLAETKTSDVRLAQWLFSLMAFCLIAETLLATLLDRRRG